MRSSLVILSLWIFISIDATTQEGSCREQNLNNVQILMGSPGINPPYTSGHVLVFKCTDENMMMYSQRTIECQTDGNWDNPYPQCGGIACKAPHICNAHPVSPERTHYEVSSRIEYKCLPGFEPQQPIQITCNSKGEWINIQDCIFKFTSCEEKSHCAKPTKNVQFMTLLDERNIFNNFDVLKYKCNKPYDKTPEGTLTCKDEKWIGTIDCTSSICPPPPLIEDGDYSIETEIDKIITKVSYSCQSYYVLNNKQKRFYMCRNGRWETPPRCLKPCKFTPEIYEEYNIQPILYDYIQHSDEEIELDCKKGWNVGNWKRLQHVKVKCSDGKITINTKCDTKNIFSE